MRMDGISWLSRAAAKVPGEPSGLLPLKGLQRGHQTTQHCLALLGAHGKQDSKHFGGQISLRSKGFRCLLSSFLTFSVAVFHALGGVGPGALGAKLVRSHQPARERDHEGGWTIQGGT